jgi:hypothetical protein
MKKTIYTVLWVVLSLVFGSLINGLIIYIAPLIIKYPVGVSFATEESTIQSMKLLHPIHFIIPFVAHALGIFISTLLMAIYVKNNFLKLAIFISVLYLFAGVLNVIMYPSPIWFIVLDLVVAYIPIGYLGAKLGVKINVFKRNN